MNLLGEIIRKSSGLRMDAFAARYLMTPLGITDYEWDHINPDIIHASGNLKLRPRDMAKFGQLFLNGGTWKNQRIISETWTKKSTAPIVSIPKRFHAETGSAGVLVLGRKRRRSVRLSLVDQIVLYGFRLRRFLSGGRLGRPEDHCVSEPGPGCRLYRRKLCHTGAGS